MNDEGHTIIPPPHLYTAITTQVFRKQPVFMRPKVHCHSTMKTNSSTQYVTENKPEFRIPPTCFGQAGPSSGRTSQKERRNYSHTFSSAVYSQTPSVHSIKCYTRRKQEVQSESVLIECISCEHMLIITC
jgi:hypothetical protein